MTIHVIIPSNPPMNMVLRSLRYDTPIHKAIKGFGQVVGGGQGARSNYIDILVKDKKLDECIARIEKRLLKSDCPAGTRIISGVWSKAVR